MFLSYYFTTDGGDEEDDEDELIRDGTLVDESDNEEMTGRSQLGLLAYIYSIVIHTAIIILHIHTCTYQLPLSISNSLRL